MTQPPRKKDGVNVGLCVSAEGKKHPAVMVFKGAAETEALSKKLVDKLAVPGIIVIVSSNSAWLNEFLDHEWIQMSFPLEEES